jgi:hypothetical protein
VVVSVDGSRLMLDAKADDGEPDGTIELGETDP